MFLREELKKEEKRFLPDFYVAFKKQAKKKERI